MDDALSFYVTKCLIVTDNFVEAVDIRDVLTEHHVGDVRHVRDAHGARLLIEEQEFQAQLAFVVCHEGIATWGSLIGLLIDAGARLVLIDGEPHFARTIGAACLTRPFDDRDIRRALRRVL